jgi:hypothetical protein
LPNTKRGLPSLLHGPGLLASPAPPAQPSASCRQLRLALGGPGRRCCYHARTTTVYGAEEPSTFPSLSQPRQRSHAWQPLSPPRQGRLCVNMRKRGEPTSPEAQRMTYTRISPVCAARLNLVCMCRCAPAATHPCCHCHTVTPSSSKRIQGNPCTRRAESIRTHHVAGGGRNVQH